MGKTYYRIAEHRPQTMTVGELIGALMAFDQAAPIVFRSPPNGSYGPDTAYSVDCVDPVFIEREERHSPGGTYIDDETGETVTYEASVQVLDAWAGVVLR